MPFSLRIFFIADEERGFEDDDLRSLPPCAADLLTLARSHPFKLLSIGLRSGDRVVPDDLRTIELAARRRFEWLFAITAMGGYKVRADVGVS